MISVPLTAAVSDFATLLRLQGGNGNGAVNASRVNDAFQNRTLNSLVVVPGGSYDFVETIGKGVLKTNWSLAGSGSGSDNVAADSYWSGSFAGGSQTTRFYWNKRGATASPLDRALVRTDALAVALDRLSLYGARRLATSGSGTRTLARMDEPTEWQAINYAARVFVTRAGEVWQAGASGATPSDEPGISSKWSLSGYRGHIGVWHQTGFERQNGPLVIPTASFGDFDIGILAGPNSTLPLANDNTRWGDTINLGYVQFFATPICVWIRT